jgi:hypothetical protein
MLKSTRDHQDGEREARVAQAIAPVDAPARSEAAKAAQSAKSAINLTSAC